MLEKQSTKETVLSPTLNFRWRMSYFAGVTRLLSSDMSSFSFFVKTTPEIPLNVSLRIFGGEN